MDRPWTKAWRTAWREECMDELGAAAKLLRWCLRDHVVDVDGDGIGWAQTEDGRPLGLPRLSRLCSLAEAEVVEGLRQLEVAGLIVSRGGVYGVLGWKETQESPAAARMRRHRSATPGVTVTPPVTPTTPPEGSEVTDRGGEDQRTEDRINNTGDVTRAPTENPGPVRGSSPVNASTSRPAHAPVDDAHPGQRLKLTRERLCMRIDAAAKLAAIPRGTLDKLESGSMQPTRAELVALAKAYGDPDLAKLPAIDGDGGATIAEQVVREIHRHRVELELAQGDSPPITAADIRVAWAPAETDRAAGRDLLAAWRTVIRRAAEEIRRDRGRKKPTRSAEFFRLDSLGGADRRRKYLDTPDLDRREELTPQARGSPRAPRITRERTYENKTHETPETEETT